MHGHTGEIFFIFLLYTYCNTKIHLFISKYYYSLLFNRQWVFNEFAGNSGDTAIEVWYTPELDIIDNFILLDVRNNSAWNQVSFLFKDYVLNVNITIILIFILYLII